MNLFCFLVSTIFFIPISFGQDCTKKEIDTKSKFVLESIRNQGLLIDQILDGKNANDLSLASIFGHDFNISKTNERISILNRNLEQSRGISIENISLIDCLKKFKNFEMIEEIQMSSISLVQKKINLLEKNRELGDSIRKTGVAENELPLIKNQIGNDSKIAVSEKNKLEDELLKKEIVNLKNQGNEKRTFLEIEKDLTKIKIELLSIQINTNRALEEKIIYFEKKTSELKRIASLKQPYEDRKLLEKFFLAEQLWKSLLSENFYDLFNLAHSHNLPDIAKIRKEKLNAHEYSTLLDLRSEILSLKKEILKKYRFKKDQELKLLNELVVSSNEIRESFFSRLSYNQKRHLFFNLDIFSKIKNELLFSPYRILSYFYSKYIYLKEQLILGKEGYVRLVSHLFQVLFFVFAIYLIRLLLKRIDKFINQFFEIVLRRKNRSLVLKKLFLFWNKVKSSFLSILWIFVLGLFKNVDTISEVPILIDIIQIFLSAKVLKSLMTVFLGNVSKLDIGNFSNFKERADHTSNKFKNIFFFYFLVILFIDTAVGKVYLSEIIKFVVYFYIILLFIIESSKWEIEFKKYCEKMFSGLFVERITSFTSYLPRALRGIIYLIFIVILLFFDLFISFTENFEISKKISANVFKKQIEGVEAENDAVTMISEGYKELFSLKSLSTSEEYVKSSNGIENDIMHEISEWNNMVSDEHSLVVYGDKGIGKTTLLKKIISLCQSSMTVDAKYVKMPSKIVTAEELGTFLKQIFSIDDEKLNSTIYDYDNHLNRKTIIVIDECQNIFLSKTGGFDAYYALVNMINLNTKNIFWVMSFNKYSWLYLDRAFGRTQYFRNVFELKGWNDTKIKELIMRRHKKDKYRLSFDLLISATRSQDEIDKYSSVESKFFKLLWELSRGNPRTALFLWISALSKKNKSTLNVNIPKDIDLMDIEKAADELLFVISHILKHENLSSLEIEETTNLPKGIVRNSIKIGLEKKYIYKDDRSRYMIDISNQYGLIRFLKVKNFIYGN